MVDIFPEEVHNRFLLIDCGATAVQSTKELRIPPWEIMGVLVTHLHGDHINGIEQLLWERFYLAGWRKTCLMATRTILDQLRAILTPCVNEVTVPPGDVETNGYDRLVQEVVLIPGEPLRYGATWFNLLRTNHVVSRDGSVDKESYGVQIRTPAGSTYYTSDTVFDPQIGKRFNNGLIFHDCTFSPKYPGTVHTHYSDLMTLPDEVKKRIVLMHYGKVPEGIDVQADGFHKAAKRHETFLL